VLVEHNVQVRLVVLEKPYDEIRPEAYCCDQCGGMWSFHEYWDAFFKGVDDGFISGVYSLDINGAMKWIDKRTYFEAKYPIYFKKHFVTLDD